MWSVILVKVNIQEQNISAENLTEKLKLKSKFILIQDKLCHALNHR